jgi:hypothetical protein
VLDVARNGRLVGVELVARPDALTRWASDPIAGAYLASTGDDRWYVKLTSGDDRDARSAVIRVHLELDAAGQIAAIGIPRRGDGYEVAFPSGNR